MGRGESAEMVQVLDDTPKADLAETVAVAAPSVVQDRRRAGRVQQVSPTLIPLLRDSDLCVDIDLDEDSNPLGPARGVMVACLVSVPFWGLIAIGCWLFF
jgi:hypothetical protein